MPGRGLQFVPVRIPPQWERALPGFTQWFQGVIRDILAYADARNIIEGPGVQVEGTPDTPATLTTSEDLLNLINQAYILANSSTFLPGERILAGESGVVKTTDGGPNDNFTIGIENGGIKGHKFRAAAALSLVGRPQATNGYVSDIPAASNDTLLTRVADRLDFTQLTLAIAPDKLWTYAKMQDATANSVLGRAPNTDGALDEIPLTAGQFVVNRGGTVQGDTLQDADIPASIARDAEVTAAIGAHEGASDPHPGYLTPAEGDAAYQPLAAVLSMLHTGTGSPETAVTAPVGHIYLRSDGGANTTLYVKESGAGNTGWVAK